MTKKQGLKQNIDEFFFDFAGLSPKNGQDPAESQPCTLTAVDESVAAAALLPLLSRCGNRACVLVPQPELAEELARQMAILSGSFALPLRMVLLPEALRGKLYVAGGEAERARTLSRVARGDFDLVIASLSAAGAPAPAPDTLAMEERVIRPGQELGFAALLEHLVKLDYDDEFEVSSPGEFARRGGIVDLYSPDEEYPARVEFFGDEIDSIRYFDPTTQRSIGKAESYRIVHRCTAMSLIAPEAGGKADPDAAPAGDFFDYLAMLKIPVLRLFPERIADGCQRCGSPELEARVRAFFASLKASLFDLVNGDRPEPSSPLPAAPSGVFPAAAHLGKELEEEVRQRGTELLDHLLAEQIRQWLDTGYAVRLCARNEEALPNVAEWVARELPDAAERIASMALPLPGGMLFPGRKMVLLTDDELFSGGRGVRRTFKSAAAPGTENEEGEPELPSIASVTAADLDEGDYAVHPAHGIGIFRGLEIESDQGTVREIMVLEYAEGAILRVPLSQAGGICRYVGGGKGAVKLHRLGGTKWKKDKLTALAAIRSYAADMLRIRAVRSAAPALPLDAPPVECRAFDAQFEFAPTPDQERSAAELDADLASAHPMDRLLCGDVGYGKTEIAMRAAYRLVRSGYQVAVMAPTTVLAQQHFYSFRQRFAGYPVVIDMLSRFRTASEQREIVKRLAAGSIDVVIGTHRLAQEDLRFKNLGLVIVDEEQRFGVKVKERLLRLRADVNVLAMSATPIPRTLYLAMAGARNLSTIATAPQQRLPVKTFVLRPDDGAIAKAIMEETARGGQVYFLHNRVKSIEDRVRQLQELCPGVRFAIGHGQMEEGELEKVMAAFLAGEVQVLVCTTIIESGLDVPNANTIIIERADRFGLAELYQLRGRVGRWKRQAFAYLVVPPHELVTPDGQRRIAAIRRYTELGSGLRLALRDLEIRGAGNLLGTEQSGYIAAIGFELYCELLKQEIAELKNEPVEWLPEVDLNVDFVQFGFETPRSFAACGFPPEYIPAPRLRIAASRKLWRLASERALEDFRKELTDRYGTLPDPVRNLLELTLAKILTAQAGYRQLTVTQNRVYLRSGSGEPFRIGGKIPLLDPAATPAIRLRSLTRIARMAVLENGCR